MTHGISESHDKGGVDAIQSAVAENPTIHANFMALCFIESELLLLLIEVLHCGNTNFFLPFCSRNLDLGPITFIYEPDRYSMESGDIPDVQI